MIGQESNHNAVAVDREKKLTVWATFATGLGDVVQGFVTKKIEPFAVRVVWFVAEPIDESKPTRLFGPRQTEQLPGHFLR